MFSRFGSVLRRHVAPPRFVLFAATLVGLFLISTLAGLDLQIGVLASFDVAALVFFASAFSLLDDDVETMRATAARNDANRVGLLTITVLILMVVLIAIGTLVADRQGGWIEVPIILASLVLAWLFANVVFTLHYAHLYYQQPDGEDHRGLDFPNTQTPDYWDFLYFSFTLGMTFQTSDVAIDGAHMRKVVLAQSVTAFFFNMGVLAFAVNTLGGF